MCSYNLFIIFFIIINEKSDHQIRKIRENLKEILVILKF